MTPATLILYSLIIGAVIAFAVLVWSYAKGLKQSPRDLWLLFAFKIIEYSAYAATNMSLVLWLSRDCGQGDVAAGSYVAAWSMVLSVMTMITGSLIDTIGIRKTLFLSVFFLFISRFFMLFVTHPFWVVPLGLVPLAIGFAIVTPLVSVAIKRYTTKEGCAMGFGLFYVLMNLGYAGGYAFFDWARNFYATRDAAGKVVDENAGTLLLGMHFSTYQMIFLFGMIATALSLGIAVLFRDNIELTEEGKLITHPAQSHGSGLAAVKNAALTTGRNLGRVMKERYFWIFIGMLALTVPVRMVFFHFHYTFPKYGVRILGEGAKVGSIYGGINPVLIIFLVPLVSYFTKKISSFRMMVVGGAISALSCFLVLVPGERFAHWTDSILGELVLVKWLHMAPDMPTLLQAPPTPFYWTMIVLITIFTIGEAIWSPRLLQFTAEIAPKGKEGAYIALASLPFFVAKFFAGPMSGMLLQAYTPIDPATQKALAYYPDHGMVWVWIGGSALLTPLSLLILRKWFTGQKIPGHAET